MGLANVDDELKYYKKFVTTRKEIDELFEIRKTVMLNDLRREEEENLNDLKREREKKEAENKQILLKLKDICNKENEVVEMTRYNKEEILRHFVKICEKRKEISKLFNNNVNEYKNKEIEVLIKELNLYMNILKLRIINLDELYNGSNVLKAYFIKNSSLKYIEIEMKDNEMDRARKFSEVYMENFKDDDLKTIIQINFLIIKLNEKQTKLKICWTRYRSQFNKGSSVSLNKYKPLDKSLLPSKKLPNKIVQEKGKELTPKILLTNKSSSLIISKNSNQNTEKEKKESNSEVFNLKAEQQNDLCSIRKFNQK